MAKPSHADVTERLLNAHATAAEKASGALEDIIPVASAAVEEGDKLTRKMFKKQEARVLKTAEKWHRTAKELAHHLRKHKG
jgi:hypothetical protein